MPVSVARSLVIIAAVAGTIFFTRLCPFLFFPPGKPIPPVIQYLGKVLPPAVIGMLVIYCLKADRKSVGVGKECRSRWSPYH